MPRKPKEEPQEPQAPAEPAPVAPPPPPPGVVPLKDKLLTVRAVLPFEDGNLREFMEQAGYPSFWRQGETRKLPRWLVERCLQSGANLERPASDG